MLTRHQKPGDKLLDIHTGQSLTRLFHNQALTKVPAKCGASSSLRSMTTKTQSSDNQETTQTVYKDKKTTITARLGQLIHVDKTKGSRYGAIDVDMLRDGSWWLPAGGEAAIHNLMQEYGVSKYELGSRTLLAWRVPVQVLDELASRLAEILSLFRCDHAETGCIWPS